MTACNYTNSPNVEPEMREMREMREFAVYEAALRGDVPALARLIPPGLRRAGRPFEDQRGDGG